MKKYILLGASALALVLLFVFAGTYYKKQQSEKISSIARENVSVFVRDHSPVLGSEEAKVVLVEFMDPACETCAAFSGYIKQLMAANPGKIKLVLRYAPFHEGADYVVKVVEAAKKQGKYWETLDLLYKTQSFWASHHKPDPQKVWQVLGQSGLDLEQLRNDMNDPVLDQILAQDLADAETLNVQKTPGFFVNGRPLETFGYQQLVQLIQSEFNVQYSN